MKKLITIILTVLTLTSYGQDEKSCTVGIMVNGKLECFEYNCNRNSDDVWDSLRIVHYVQISDSELHELDLLIVKYVNKHRASYGLSKLKWDSDLYKITKSHTEYQFSSGVVEHEENGKTYSERVRENGVYMGECVLLTSGVFTNLDVTAKDLVSSWINSPSHNRILLGKKSLSISVSTKLGIYYDVVSDHTFVGGGVSTLNVRY